MSDISRLLTGIRDRLKAELANLKGQKDHLNKKLWEHETGIARGLDCLEGKMQQANTCALRLQMIPAEVRGGFLMSTQSVPSSCRDNASHHSHIAAHTTKVAFCGPLGVSNGQTQSAAPIPVFQAKNAGGVSHHMELRKHMLQEEPNQLISIDPISVIKPSLSQLKVWILP